MDREYWTNKYATDPGDNDPSLFARSCMATAGHRERKVHAGDSLLELGHGNGRDAFWFAKMNVSVIGVDQSGLVANGPGFFLEQHDFTNPSVMMKRFEGMTFDHVYSRFSWHSITRLDEINIVEWITNVLNPDGSLLIECRTIFDDLMHQGIRRVGHYTREYTDGHRRRFIDPASLLGYLLEENFVIKYAETDTGFAPYKDEDPIVLRVHAVLKGQS